MPDWTKGAVLRDGLPVNPMSRSELRTVPSSALPRFTLFLVLLLVLSGCSAPTKAPVVSHDLSTKRGSKVKIKPAKGYYRVKKGDTLFSIAWQHGLDHKRLAVWNRIKAPFTIYPEQSLRLTPPKAAKKTAAMSKTQTRKSASVTKKTVKTTKKQVKSKQQRAPAQKSRTKRTKGSVKSAGEGVKLAWRWPTKGGMKQGFLPGDPSRKGIKIAGHLGQMVVAAEKGRIVYAGSGLIGYGRLIIIKHNKNYLSAYGYNRKILVKEGDQVIKGAKIAEMGTQGTGESLLHFEIRRNGTPVNPLKLLPRKR
ncbi:MAG: peptidoglycan DD-metalloendopeptidase family protein [Chromatiales bacterium]|nr:peptidoglycan DD-metalloendopeptidase family protein [Chromatiales bacterium]